jgi:uncharacterized protein YdhG (YjbR/CyaY superfamily)
MQALNDDQRIAAVEKKIDDGFAEMRREFRTVRTEMRTEIKASERELRSEIISARSDARADFRTLVALVVSLWAATVLTVLAAHL